MTFSSLKQRYAIPRVSTRGYFDLRTGELKKDKKMFGYFLYPKSKFDKILKAPEIVIFVHGMRNSRKGSVMGINTLRIKLRKLGYKHPVIGFTYDADVRGAYLEKNHHKVLETAYSIASDNTRNLFAFIRDLQWRHDYKGKIRLVGHSLGCIVVAGVLTQFDYREIGFVESVHMFGSPIESGFITTNYYMIEDGVKGKFVNYYNIKDEVIREGVEKGDLKDPICLRKIPNVGKKVIQKRIKAEDHRFKTYVDGLRSFP